MRIFVMVLIIMMTGSAFGGKTPGIGKTFTGKASYYHKKFHGRKTASGEIFNNNAFTCAHKSITFNSILKVKNRKNGKHTFCRVNDIGPFSKGRIIDLSRRAAKDISMIHDGIAKVVVTVHCTPGKGGSRYGKKNPLVKCIESPGARNE